MTNFEYRLEKLRMRIHDGAACLNVSLPRRILNRMSNKEIVTDLLQRIPDSASLNEIAREIEFVAAVRQGLAEIDSGKVISLEEVEGELPSWIIK